MDDWYKSDYNATIKTNTLCKFSAPWPLSSRKKMITMIIYVKSMLAVTLLRP